MAGTYRYWLICLPSVDPNTLLLFTENDVDGGKIRDYSIPGRVREVRRVFPDAVPEVFRSSTKTVRVQPHQCHDDKHWRNEIQKYVSDGRDTRIKPKVSSSSNAPIRSKGSAYQIQRWVNERAEELQQAIWSAFPKLANVQLRWVSPLASESFREYQDQEFLRVIEQAHLSSELAQFWPRGGPVWDALAVLERPRVGVVLVEAKAYPEEAEDRNCRAEGESLARISRRLAEVKDTLGAEVSADWLGSRYQVANRLAHLHFLRSHRVPAWYVQVCFCDDATHRPTPETRWREALPILWQELGLSGPPPFVADVLLAACVGPTYARDVGGVTNAALQESPAAKGRGSILDGTDVIINQALGVADSGLSWRDQASVHYLRVPKGEEAVAFVEDVIQRIGKNWDGTMRGSGQNWRWCPVVDQHIQGGEVGLQKTIVKNCGADWVNAIPTASGLMPGREEKQRNVDLGHLRNASECELIELKLSDGRQHPLAAAIQLLRYACLYFHARENAGRMATKNNAFLLGVQTVRFQVLSFRSFYRGFDLRELEEALHAGIAAAAVRRGLRASFQMTHFPENFSWTGSNVSDLDHALRNRTGLHGSLM